MERRPLISCTNRPRITEGISLIRGFYSSRYCGQTLVETAAALGVIAVVVAALLAMGIAGMRAAAFSRNKTMADLIANEALEAMRAKKNGSADFAGDFPNGSCFQMNTTPPRSIVPGTVSCTSGGQTLFQTYQQGSVVTSYLYNIGVTNATQGGVSGKLVKATVRFTDSGGDHDSVVETFFTSWQ